MTKPSKFMWGWNDYPPWDDELMTRQRAAKLLRCWRRVLRQPANSKPIKALRRVSAGTYRVESTDGEVGTMIVCRGER